MNTNSKNIIVLGGAGYIGSHTCKLLDTAGYTPIVVDNLSRGHKSAVKWGPFEQADLADTSKLASIMKKYEAAAVIHFAALIEVGESVKNPGAFWQNNVTGTLSVLNAMEKAKVPHIVFSSTAAVYGQPDTSDPLKEDLPLNPINPYGNTKLAAERLIRDYERPTGITSVCLRYFNACGADMDGEIGEMHYPETHLIPLIAQTSLGIRDRIHIFGTDYDTPDGTCIRDYIHVTDLANAHLLAVEHLLKGGQTLACNLGTGKGYSVREIIDTVKQVGDRDFKVVESDRREGDPAFLVADNSLARKALGWSPQIDLPTIARTALDWHASDEYRSFWKEATADHTEKKTPTPMNYRNTPQ